MNKELSCMGFKVTGFDLIIKKGYVQTDINFARTNDKDVEFCEKFENAMKEGPIRAFEEISRDFPEVEGLAA